MAVASTSAAHIKEHLGVTERLEAEGQSLIQCWLGAKPTVHQPVAKLPMVLKTHPSLHGILIHQAQVDCSILAPTKADMLRLSTLRVALALLAILLIGSCSKADRLTQRTESMFPTIRDGEQVLVNKSAYTAIQPKRWDVVAFEHKEALWIFRVAGLPGDIVSFDEKGLLINSEHPLKPPALAQVEFTAPHALAKYYITFPYRVPTDSYFVLGDNPHLANDSRMWGALHRDKLVGKVEGR